MNGVKMARRVLAAIWFAGFLLPVAASAACTQQNAENLINRNLDMRLQFLKHEKRMPVYKEASPDGSARIQRLILQKDWNGVCKAVFREIAVADDVLAGGDGKSETLKTPWSKSTPEKMFSLMAEYDVICTPGNQTYVESCGRQPLTPLRREMVQLKAQANGGKVIAARYVDRMSELYTKMLEIIRK